MAPQPLVAKKILDDAVLNGLLTTQNVIEKQVTSNNYNFTANVNTPWFESWRENFIKIGFPSDHEFLKHYIACIFVVSTSHLDPLDQFQKLLLQTHQQSQANTANRFPKWLFPNFVNIYKYFVLLHDVQEGEIAKAHQIYENLKNNYGSSNCHLLQINSKQAQPVTSLIQPEQSSNISNEFDPWLQYCKFNDLYNNNSISHSTLEESNLTQEENQADSIEHPLDGSLNQIIKPIKRHGACLALSDHDRIKTFLSEFLQRGLVPFAERTIKILNEQIQSKKSILKSFSIPRKLFGSSSTSLASKNASPGPVVAVSSSNLTSNSVNGSPVSTSAGLVTITNNFINSNDDFQLRRLADLAFMFRMYDLAYTSYHSCKKDFSNYINSNSYQSNAEQILNMKLYLAGALEMSSISSFMQNFANIDSSANMPSSISTSSLATLSLTGSSKTFNTQYIEEAIQILFNECKNIYFATRSVLLSTETLKANNLYLKAAHQFINLANDENDVRSALFLEQAAQCYLAQPVPWVRKYAFFMSLAGHRFNKTGQKKHSLRVYKHAIEIYDNKSWFKVLDQINYTMSRQNYNLKNLTDALVNIENILVKKLPQKPHKHHHHHSKCHTNLIEFSNELNVLRDFIIYHNLLNSENKQNNLPIIPLPIIDYDYIIVNLNPADYSNLKYGFVLANNQTITNCFEEQISSKTNKFDQKRLYLECRDMWQKFEENLYLNAYRTSIPILFKPNLNLLNKYTDNKQMPKLVIDEWASVDFEVKNSLKINLVLSDCTLLWKFVDQSNDNQEITNESEIGDSFVECSSIKEILLAPFKEYKLRLLFKPKKPHGHLHILGIKYKFSLESIWSGQSEEAGITKHFVNGKHLFEIRGPRLNNTQQAMRSVVYDTDNRLNLKTINKTALLQVEMSHIPTFMMCNQLERVKIYFVNLSDQFSIGNLKIASNGIQSSHLCFDDINKNNKLEFDSNEFAYLKKCDFKYKENLDEHNDSSNDMSSKFQKSISESNDFIYSLDDVVINPNEHYEIDMWIRAPETQGEFKFYFMFFYEDNSNPPTTPKSSSHGFKYRILRYEFSIFTSSSLNAVNTNIICSQTNSNHLLNLEIANKNNQSSFELIESISVSDIWKVNPVSESDGYFLKPLSENSMSTSKSSTSIDSLKAIKTKPTKSSEEILSMIVKANPLYLVQNSDIAVHRSAFKSSQLGQDMFKPDDFVFLHFIKSDLRKKLANLSNNSNYLYLNLLWKAKTVFEEEETIKYIFMPGKIVEILDNNPKIDNAISNINNIAKNLILITFKCEPFVSKDFALSPLCSVSVNIEFKNLCSFSNFELAVVAKNPLCNDLEKNYLWIGCNKKFLKLKSSQSKKVHFKLGFISNGVFEIGRLSNENLIKMNLLEATSVTSFDDLIDNDIKNGLISNHPSKANQMESTAICVYLKNPTSQRFELLKRLNPFTVIIDA